MVERKDHRPSFPLALSPALSLEALEAKWQGRRLGRAARICSILRTDMDRNHRLELHHVIEELVVAACPWRGVT